MAYSDVVSLSNVLNGIVKLRESYHPMESLKEFHETFAPDQREDDLHDKIARRMNLIDEEYDEAVYALNYLHRSDLGATSSVVEEALVEVAAELADLLYVVYGTAEELGIPLEAVFNEIHRANMRKVWDDGQVHRNDFGKVVKPPNFVKADIRKVLYGQSDNTERG